MRNPETTTVQSNNNYIERRQHYDSYDYSSPEIQIIEATTRTDHYTTLGKNYEKSNRNRGGDNDFYKSNQEKDQLQQNQYYFHNSAGRFIPTLISFYYGSLTLVLLLVL